MSSDESDIFTLTPLFRTPLFKNRSQISYPPKQEKYPPKQEKRNTTNLRRSQRTLPKRKSVIKQRLKEEDDKSQQNFKAEKRKSDELPVRTEKKLKEENAWCSSCQLLWEHFEWLGKSREEHLKECLEVDWSNKKECKSGLYCDHKDEYHYWQCTHRILARARTQEASLLATFSGKLEENLTGVTSRKQEVTSPKDDSGYEDISVPGPSGWKKPSSRPSVVDLSDQDSTDNEGEQDGKSTVLFSLMRSGDTSSKHSFSNWYGNSGSSTEICVPNKEQNVETNPRDNSNKIGSDDEDFFREACIPDLDMNCIDDTEQSVAAESQSLLQGDGSVAKVVIRNHEVSVVEKATDVSRMNAENMSRDVDTYADDESTLSGLGNGVNENQNKRTVEKSESSECRKAPSDNNESKKVDENTQCQHSCQPCVHLHFHAEKLPQGVISKNGQTTIKMYFQPINTKAPESSNKEECTSCSQCECKKKGETQNQPRNSKVPGKTGENPWKDILSRMRGPPSVSSDSITLEEIPPVQKRYFGGKPSGQQRQCPFYKYIPDTGFVVDAFNFGYVEGVSAYFLSHFHYDHYVGLKKSFNRPIYCSEITGKLVNMKIKVDTKYLHTLPMDTPRVISGVEVTLLDANHCPGSVMFLFKLRTGSTILHVGDFRAHPIMESYPALWNSSIDVLFLDTTYCNPVYDFPSQEDVLEKCTLIASDHVKDNSRALIVVGSYTIGKERVFKSIATALNCRIWANTEKQRILQCLNDKEISSRLTTDKKTARVHVLSMNSLRPKTLEEYVVELMPKFNTVVAFRPTGWEHSAEIDDSLEKIKPKQNGNVYIYGIPYSEHSSYAELRRFVQFTLPKKVIPTVNVGNPNTRKRMESTIQDWIKESKKTSNSIDKYFK